MRTTIGVIVLMLLAVSARPVQAQVTATPGQSIAWNYVDADLTTFSVTSFQVCYDGATSGCQTVTPTVGKFSDPTVPAGQSAYKLQLPTTLSVGPAHTVLTKACNASGCGGGTAPFPFTLVLPAPPAPTGVRLVP